MQADALPFQDFQRALARHLRDPAHAPRPPGAAGRGARAYGELLFNNIRGFADACFPVSRAVLGEPRWRRLVRCFYRDWPLHTPWFREIPREFVRYLAEAPIAQPLPRWLPELAHYEWVELAVEVMDCATPAADPAGDLLHGQVVVNPALMNLAYRWPVERIGPGVRPRRPDPVWLLVFRTAGDAVRFSRVSPVTARLVALLASQPLSGEAALEHLAAELAHPSPAQLRQLGAVQLAELRHQGVLLGTVPEGAAPAGGERAATG